VTRPRHITATSENFALRRASGRAHKARMSTRTRTPVVPSLGAFVALAIIAFAGIYYGAVPWALSRVIGATFWLLGWR
jgi:type VI protein secretion system component VasF